MKKNIQNAEVSNKKVIVRCDFNVTLKDGAILDDTKIVKSLKTIRYLIEQNASVIMLSHFGKVKDEASKSKNSLMPVAVRLAKLLNKEVKFIPITRGDELTLACSKILPGQLLLVENTRFEDVPNNLESSNDQDLAKYWSSLGEVFINDAFGSSHRAHASVCGITNYLPSYNGFIIQDEIENLNQIIINPERPFVVIMGGAKVDDKIELIKSLIPKCDYLVTGGGIANTFLLAEGYNVGKSLVNAELVSEVKELLNQYNNKIILPIDVIVGSGDPNYHQAKGLNDIKEDEMIYDIGEKSLSIIDEIIKNAKTIFVNGTIGLYENTLFAKGTETVLKSVANSQAASVAAGGDSVSAVNHFELGNKFTFLSTGGGASLEYLIDGTLPGIIK